MCPWGSMKAPGMCRDVSAAAAPEREAPLSLLRAFLLSAACRVGRRSGIAIGDGVWAPECESRDRQEGEWDLWRSWGGVGPWGWHREAGPTRGCLAVLRPV